MSQGLFFELRNHRFKQTPITHLAKLPKFRVTELNVKIVSRKTKFQVGSSYLATTLNLLSLFGFVPFHVKLNSSSGSYQILQIHLFRKGICAFNHILYVATMGTYFVHYLFLGHTDFFIKSSSTAGQVIEVTSTLGSVLLSLSFFHSFWRKQDEILAIIHRTHVLCGSCKMRLRQILATVLFLVSYVTTNYTLRYYNSNATPTEDFDKEFQVDFSLIIKMYLMHVSSFTYLSFLVLTILGITLKDVKNRFRIDLHQHKGIDEGLLLCTKLKRLSTDISDLFGWHILAFYIVSVAYYADVPLLSFQGWNAKLVAMCALMVFGVLMWGNLAEFHMDSSDSIKRWLARMEDEGKMKDVEAKIKMMSSVVSEGIPDSIGISCKFFTVTYGFLGSMLGLILTYAIIVLQQNTASTPQDADSPRQWIPDNVHVQ